MQSIILHNLSLQQNVSVNLESMVFQGKTDSEAISFWLIS